MKRFDLWMRLYVASCGVIGVGFGSVLGMPIARSAVTPEISPPGILPDAISGITPPVTASVTPPVTPPVALPVMQPVAPDRRSVISSAISIAEFSPLELARLEANRSEFSNLEFSNLEFSQLTQTPPPIAITPTQAAEDNPDEPDNPDTPEDPDEPDNPDDPPDNPDTPDDPEDPPTDPEPAGGDSGGDSGGEADATATDASADNTEDGAADSTETGDEEDEFSQAIADARKINGLFDLYYNEDNGTLLAELDPDEFGKTYLLIMTLSRGIGDLGLVNGLPLADLLFFFQKQGENVHLVLPNVNFRFERSTPRATDQPILDRSFSDSVLYSFPIVATHPDRDTILIDLTEFLTVSDTSGFMGWLSFLGYTPDSAKSYVNPEIRAYPENLELEAIVGLSGDAWVTSDTLPDPRNFNLGIRYSLSVLPNNPDYRPRPADNRLGYFISAYQDLSNPTRSDPFVRNIQRWHLEKQDPDAPLSPPVEPIVFWIENTVPPEYRQAVRDGILAWNLAFERAGFENAIEVRQMPDDADWDPEDVRYNVVRWLTTYNIGFAGLGPSRVNPLTGEILDADILIDGNIVRFATNQIDTYLDSALNSLETFNLSLNSSLAGALNPSTASPRGSATGQGQSGQGITAGRGRSLINLSSIRQRCQGEACDRLDNLPDFIPLGWRGNSGYFFNCGCPQCLQGRQIGALALPLLQGVLPYRENFQTYLNQYITHVVAHEVGHTLGLRHNFHGSTMLTPEQLNDQTLTAERGMVASVMDYMPVNLAPPGVPQGDYYATRIGPYDEWAIEYGYRDFSQVGTTEERRQLRELANQATNSQLAFGHDEDLWTGTDPDIQWFDLSQDPTAYAHGQLENARLMWDRLGTTALGTLESPDEARQKFGIILNYYFSQLNTLLTQIGGQSFTRTAPEAGDRRVPLTPLPIERQQESLNLLMQYAFAPNAMQFSPDLLNQLVPSRWSHWGENSFTNRLDYPILEQVSAIQQFFLVNLLSGDRLNRLRDLEFKAEAGEALTLPELFDQLDRNIWSEITSSSPRNVNSVRRELQRSYVNLQIAMVLGQMDVPEDAKALARRSLQQASGQIKSALDRSRAIDVYTQAHLEDTQVRIEQALNASRFSY